MKIDQRVLDTGLNRDIIIELHSKTKLSNFDINYVKFIRKYDGLITMQLDLRSKDGRSSRQMSLDITEKKLIKFKRSLILDNLGI